MNTFYNQMFNPQYVNPDYYHELQRQQYEFDQQKEIVNAVKAIHDLCEAVKKIDANHQQQAVNACDKVQVLLKSMHIQSEDCQTVSNSAESQEMIH